MGDIRGYRKIQLSTGEAAKKALGIDNIQERIFIVKLINDKNDPSKIAGAVGFSTRDDKIVVYKAKAILLAAGGCVNIFRST